MIRKRHSVIVSSLIIALGLQIVPLPIQVDLYRPDWVLVVLSYWCMALPHRVNVGIAFVTGIAGTFSLAQPWVFIALGYLPVCTF